MNKYQIDKINFLVNISWLLNLLDKQIITKVELSG